MSCSSQRGVEIPSPLPGLGLGCSLPAGSFLTLPRQMFFKFRSISVHSSYKILCYVMAAPLGLWDFSSPSRDWILVFGSESTES